jgi:hypothetical protein
MHLPLSLRLFEVPRDYLPFLRFWPRIGDAPATIRIHPGPRKGNLNSEGLQPG